LRRKKGSAERSDDAGSAEAIAVRVLCHDRIKLAGENTLGIDAFGG